MSYLFFDIEAANRHNKTAKMYSFGYVLTDSKFNVIKKEEIIINPEADYYFNKKEEGHVSIPCPFPKDIMDKAKTLPDNYEKINQLVSSNLCIGYGTAIDAHMLHESCKRNGLGSMKFDFLDLVEISDFLLKKKVPGLNNLAEHLGIVNDNPHNGLADALTTYEICKKLLEDGRSNLITMVYNKSIHKFVAKRYRVYKITKEKAIPIPQRKFKDMLVKDVDIVKERMKVKYDEETVPKNTLREEVMKWVKEAEYQETHTHNNN